MKKNTKIFATAAAALLPLFFASPAAAQATRTWVSGVGDDANPCSRTAPCKTFPGAISKTAPGGEIDVLDPGGFGAVTITKAITIAAEGTGEGGILVAGTNAITISAGANDAIVLRGLQIDGGPIGSNSLNGVKFITGGSLAIQNCVIRNFTGGSPNGYGIAFTPSSNASLFVSDTVLSSNGTGTAGGGIFIQPSGSANVNASIIRVNAVNNVLGIRADGTVGSGMISVMVSDSTASANVYGGMAAISTSAPIKMSIMRSSSTNNGIGLNANGSLVAMRIGESAVTGNGTGVFIGNNAALTSIGSNVISDNAIAGPTITITGGQ